MTTYVQFSPQPTQAFSFSALLDGQGITCQVPWSLFGNRWYLTMTDANGFLFCTRALAASADPIPIKNIEWHQDNGILVETIAPHLFDYMQTCYLTLSGATPATLNGLWSCFILSPTTFIFQYPTDPGAITSFGQVSSDINLAAGYFSVSTLVFRQSTQLFEIGP